MQKILVVCGPTATGKTKLAINLAKKFGGELISADSRQVYQRMDIGTGKDLPRNAKLNFLNKDLKRQGVGCYEIGGIRVWGYDLFDPKEEVSVAAFLNKLKSAQKQICLENKLPIVAGGTGLYINALVDGIGTVGVEKNEKLRNQLEGKSVEDLREILKACDPSALELLNKSDRNNSRRLIRSIELAKVGKSKKSAKKNTNSLWIGLKIEKEDLKRRIEKRVKERIKMGFEDEVRGLFGNGVGEGFQSMNATGYKEFILYIKGKKNLEVAKKDWAQREVRYTKRQMTWFTKEKRINWFDVDSSKYPKNVEKLVKKWYT